MTKHGGCERRGTHNAAVRAAARRCASQHVPCCKDESRTSGQGRPQRGLPGRAPPTRATAARPGPAPRRTPAGLPRPPHRPARRGRAQQRARCSPPPGPAAIPAPRRREGAENAGAPHSEGASRQPARGEAHLRGGGGAPRTAPGPAHGSAREGPSGRGGGWGGRGRLLRSSAAGKGGRGPPSLT